jgi:putative ATPase
MDLFTHAMNDRMQSEAPLAARMRPRTLDEYLGRDTSSAPANCFAGLSRPNVCSHQSSYGDRREAAKRPWR